MTLKERVDAIETLFNAMHGRNASSYQIATVAAFRKRFPELNDDLDFCFEVLAGQHKVGYTAYTTPTMGVFRRLSDQINDCTTSIKDFYEMTFKTEDLSEAKIQAILSSVPEVLQNFFVNLINRNYKLGYSNKSNMVSNLSPMLAKKYPESHRHQMYYIQEKLDGNRCIAYFDIEENVWKFRSRSGKPLNVKFDMSWASIGYVFDGEIMTLGKAGSRDFNRTSGAINGKYTDKSALHYFIYDLIQTDAPYELRKRNLELLKSKTSDNVSILPVLDLVMVNANPDYNIELDFWLDHIVDKGGEGIMLRDPNGKYECGKRSAALLKYKKLKTMDLRIVGWKDGNGKYEGMIGSFTCESDDGKYLVNVAGISDEIRASDPEQYIGDIVEIAYFDESKSPDNDYHSLRFPRIKRWRDDKDTTSTY